MMHFRRSYYLCHYLRKIATSQYHEEVETDNSLLASPPGENQRDAQRSSKYQFTREGYLKDTDIREEISAEEPDLSVSI